MQRPVALLRGPRNWSIVNDRPEPDQDNVLTPKMLPSPPRGLENLPQDEENLQPELVFHDCSPVRVVTTENIMDTNL